ncbi:MAG TPA: hypothetical protein VFW45_11125, partial [Candidatus Polarisedimenticolia bacterium]|nr:hypothetical protein [Candidatus Polarisedimenticolia bacterium]
MNARLTPPPTRALLLVVTALLAALIGSPPGALAGGPWHVMSNGTPMAWPGTPPGTLPVAISCDVDAGGLGLLSHGEASVLLQQALGTWNVVGPVTLSIDSAHPLPDVNATGFGDTNTGHFSNFWNRSDAVSGSAIKVIFDSDGAIIADLYGEGAQRDIFGLALIDTPTPCPPVSSGDIAE